MFEKILIANRGEIALRIIRGCHELGIKTVAVYSSADELSLHVRFADEAVCIGPPPSNDSYLNIPSILSAAELTNSSAIHPGYGFLSERPEFAQICQENNFVFIGPSAEIISTMGEKATAKNTMKKAGVPVVPGSDGVVSSIEEAHSIASAIGYPVMLKATAGGGGRGMRLVKAKEDLEKLYLMASSEAEKAFNNGKLYVEKFVQNPRHIEIQILADHFGNVIHFGERECSIQRRHQKLIEESPSPAINDDIRKRMGEAAVKGAKSIGYSGLGTVEFLFDGITKEFYFMEMNTRIQVEHPVTEMVIGKDLVKAQIKIASGDEIPDNIGKFKLRGHSIECRINAEDPARDFMPSPGKVKEFHAPGGNGVRMDSHIYAGYEIPPHYDSLIGKLIVHADDRLTAINRMQRALEEIILEGPKTTIPFHQAIMKDKTFQGGDFNTSFIDSFSYT
ncbi:MAG: acetyl-CoA carboxylase biotin carboxylase subunit [Candidatus Marinimicrobia bacterium]|nr:acetyl-CoA carboxylase biotin carboxylase subunit [Candidatus Neomarinimicrobiota bacterium]|tara:strand:- start:4250 stop:5596 length:1347 start_codon:yes stop_codon:yes gene_type:complete